MRVLQVINSLGTGGAEKLLLDSIPLYNEKGIQMDILVLQEGDYPFQKELFELNCCEIFSLGKRSVYNPLHIFRIIKFFKRYDILHVHLFPALYWVALSKIIIFSKTKIIYTEHCTTNRRMENSVFKIFDSFIYTFYDRIISISNEVDVAIKKYISMHKNSFELINNGVDIKKISNSIGYDKTDLGLPIKNTDKLLIQVSRFQTQKDQPTLIKAMQHLPNDVKLLLVGQGELKQECEALVKSIGLQERVFFLGVRMDVPQLLKTADIIVLSTHFEGLSLSSIEGLASGKPFVASEAPGLIEIVKGAGIVFPIQDDKILASKIQKLLSDELYYNEVVKNCLIRAKEYDINTMVDKYIGVYNDLV